MANEQLGVKVVIRHHAHTSMTLSDQIQSFFSQFMLDQADDDPRPQLAINICGLCLNTLQFFVKYEHAHCSEFCLA